MPLAISDNKTPKKTSKPNVEVKIHKKQFKDATSKRIEKIEKCVKKDMDYDAIKEMSGDNYYMITIFNDKRQEDEPRGFVFLEEFNQYTVIKGVYFNGEDHLYEIWEKIINHFINPKKGLVIFTGKRNDTFSLFKHQNTICENLSGEYDGSASYIDRKVKNYDHDDIKEIFEDYGFKIKWKLNTRNRDKIWFYFPQSMKKNITDEDDDFSGYVKERFREGVRKDIDTMNRRLNKKINQKHISAVTRYEEAKKVLSDYEEEKRKASRLFDKKQEEEKYRYNLTTEKIDEFIDELQIKIKDFKKKANEEEKHEKAVNEVDMFAQDSQEIGDGSERGQFLDDVSFGDEFSSSDGSDSDDSHDSEEERLKAQLKERKEKRKAKKKEGSAKKSKLEYSTPDDVLSPEN